VQHEARFNEYLAGELAREYQKETGQSLRFERVPDRFPDAIFTAPDGSREIGAEFVEVTLQFVLEELGDFDSYRRLFRETLQAYRPRFKNVQIRLQPSIRLAVGVRPARLPPKGARKRQLVREFEQLMLDRFEVLLPNYGGLLRELRIGDKPAYPLLSRYFDAIILNRTGDDPNREPHPDDPVIAIPAVIYNEPHIAAAVWQAIKKKLDKGYTADILLLHTYPRVGQPHSGGVAFHQDLITEIGRRIAGDVPTVSERFKEVWLLNVWSAASDPGRRLYRLR